MEKKTIGSFIAALRRANGMTQQELADRLHVSNKAVSRWEREESAPDLTLIPVLAEIFGITSDELLRGERSGDKKTEPPQNRDKAEKQLRYLVSRSLRSFKTSCMIAIMLSVIGLILLYAVSYGFYKPQIGFALLAILAAASITLTGIAMMRLREVREENELISDAEASLSEKIKLCEFRFSALSFGTSLLAFALGLPLICYSDSSFESVITFSSYLYVLPPFLLATGILLLNGIPAYKSLILGIRPIFDSTQKNCAKITAVQGALALLFAILIDGAQKDFYSSFLSYIALLPLLGVFISVPIFCRLFRTDKKDVLISGIRNALLTLILMLYLDARIVGKVVGDGYEYVYVSDDRATNFFLILFSIALLVTAEILRRRIKKTS